ncbi:MAG: hypothetical protein ACREFQ_04945 [Stellaceae bacterium]
MAALLAACIGDTDLRQPLSGPTIRMDIIGRTFTGIVGNQRFFVTFHENGTATYVGAEAQYVHWRAGPEGLCIRWYDAAAEKCGPVHLLGYASYRVGTITMTEISGPKRF